MSSGGAEYQLTPEAERDVENIWRYTLEEWGVEKANRYVDDIVESFGLLVDSPGLGAPCDHIRQGYRRVIFREHAIYYYPTDDGIAVIRILHRRMDAQRHLAVTRAGPTI